MKVSLLLLFLFLLSNAQAQNLMEERIWKVAAHKKSIFLNAGIFHLNSNHASSITGVRNSAGNGRGFERVVIDFNTPQVPKLYGHITAGKKLSVDFFNTSIQASQPQMKNSQFVQNVDFVTVDGQTITMEMGLKGKSSFDIFYLENPGRLVIDIR